MNEQYTTEYTPEFLKSFENLTAHFDEHFGELGSNERGDTFLDLALKVVTLDDAGQNFPPLRESAKKTHDGGVDLYTTENSKHEILCVQSKYKIRSKDQFDNIVSKFRNYECNLLPAKTQFPLFPPADDEPGTPPVPIFIIVTSSKLEGIVARYEKSTLASREYYSKLLAEDRLFIIDGPKILRQLYNLYKKTHLIPSNISLESVSGWVACNNVWFGAVAGTDLVALYDEHGDSLFFENIRDFLGTTSGKTVTTRSTVNQEIIKTISNEPDKMLARNNGVTFRTSSVGVADNDVAQLAMAAIINGCQTTMCLVHCAPVSRTASFRSRLLRQETHGTSLRPLTIRTP